MFRNITKLNIIIYLEFAKALICQVDIEQEQIKLFHA